MKKAAIVLLASSLVLCVFSAIGQAKDSTEAEGSSTTAAPIKTGEADKAKEPEIDPDMVVAKVDDEKITYEQLRRELSRLGQGQSMDMMEMMEPRVLEGMIRKIAIKKYLSTIKAPKVKDEEIAEQMKEIRASVKRILKMSLEDYLDTSNQTYAEFEEMIRQDMRVIKYLESQVSDTEVEQYFDANKEQFDAPETVRASHILIKVEDSDAEALKKIKKIQKELKDGANFAEMAEEHSGCPSGANGGDLDYFPRRGTGAMVEEFGRVAFALKVGEVSDPVKTQFGYHLIKLTDRKPAQKGTLENSREKIKQTLSQGDQ